MWLFRQHLIPCRIHTMNENQMYDSGNRFLYIIGIIACIYVTARYLLPLALKVLVWLIGIVLYIAGAALLMFGILWLTGYISKSLKQ